jgi:lysophospholipase L1-like esterase
VKFRYLVILAAAVCLGQDSFHLKNGDRVVFFGDSITDQRLYTTFVETFALTRFPNRDIHFVHSGWGGDRVTGGGGGGIAQRLERDVIAYRPSVVTIMLGMNDGRYRAFDQQIFDIYATGYRNIVARLKKEIPQVRITAIQPSPFDDVTRPPQFTGGYNGVLLRYADFIKELAAKEQIHLADLNTPVTAMLRRAKATDDPQSRRIIPDRVHPGASGHLIMAASLLKAWQAPPAVSEVTIDAASRGVSGSANTTVDGLRFASSVEWTQTDRALPMPVDLNDPVMALAVRSSDFMDSLNRHLLKVTGLPAGNHTLLIDDEEIATFTAAQLASGVNLAAFRTPMWAQATQLHALTLKHNAIHFSRWRNVEVPLEWEKPGTVAAALSAMDAVEAELVKQQRSLAKPSAHRFRLIAGGSQFQEIFNGKDLTGWHISKTNHHGQTPEWKVEEGVITGTQDRPGHGGILLTDRKYRNFEISLEINPSSGCDGGLFLRSNEQGQAYQVMLDYLDGGSIGGIYGERLEGVRGVAANWRPHWKSGTWNHLRARIEGDAPHIQVWLNGIRITDWRDTANHAVGGAAEGMIAVQVHGGNRWIPGGKHRFRNVKIRELE